MKKLNIWIILVLSLAGAAASYFSYSSTLDTPPFYYDSSSMNHMTSSPTVNYYGDGTHRKVIYEGIHPIGSQLLDKNDKVLEENVYALSNQSGDTVLMVSETKYYTFWGQYHRIVALVLLLLGLGSLFFLILTIVKKNQHAKG